MRKNGTLTSKEQTAALARIDHEISVVEQSLQLFASTHGGNEAEGVREAMQEAWNALHDAETALRAERRRVWLNVPASAVERMMANVD